MSSKSAGACPTVRKILKLTPIGALNPYVIEGLPVSLEGTILLIIQDVVSASFLFSLNSSILARIIHVAA